MATESHSFGMRAHEVFLAAAQSPLSCSCQSVICNASTTYHFNHFSVSLRRKSFPRYLWFEEILSPRVMMLVFHTHTTHTHPSCPLNLCDFHTLRYYCVVFTTVNVASPFYDIARHQLRWLFGWLPSAYLVVWNLLFR